MLLYLVRHAWAFERDEDRFPDDRQRPLTPKGIRRFRRVARRLVRRGVRPTLVATSPLVRCRQTADLLVEQLPQDVQLEEVDALTPGSDLDRALAWAHEKLTGHDLGIAEVAWVGHSPDVEELCARLIGDGHASLRFPKGAVAAIRFADAPAAGAGLLEWFATPRLLGR